MLIWKRGFRKARKILVRESWFSTVVTRKISHRNPRIQRALVNFFEMLVRNLLGCFFESIRSFILRLKSQSVGGCCNILLLFAWFIWDLSGRYMHTFASQRHLRISYDERWCIISIVSHWWGFMIGHVDLSQFAKTGWP